jgi:hypothetical protein
VIDLPYSIPVFFVYATSWVEDDGTLSVRKDIYGRESTSSRAVTDVTPSPRPSSGISSKHLPMTTISRKARGSPAYRELRGD